MKTLALILVFAVPAFAHKGHHPAPHTQEAKILDVSSELKSAQAEISSTYKRDVAHIFDDKCSACHSMKSPSPWYSKIPGLHQVIEEDRSEAKEHLEISKGFPFGGHGLDEEDLEAIRDDVTENSMPPKFYSLMHPSSKLTRAEKQKILEWVQNSQNLLKKKAL